VTDIFVERDDPATIEQLLEAARRHAQATGASMLELVGFPSRIRRIAMVSRPLELVQDAWPFLFRASDPTLNRALGTEALWYASLYDGDGAQ
jgi:hypothetical protein